MSREACSCGSGMTTEDCMCAMAIGLRLARVNVASTDEATYRGSTYHGVARAMTQERDEADAVRLRHLLEETEEAKSALKAERDEWEATAFRLATWLIAYRRYDPPQGIGTWSESHNQMARSLMRKAREQVMV